MLELKLPGARRPYTGAHTDSREVQPGGAFFALRGAATDGHRFVADAIGRGAAAVVVERDVEVPQAVDLIRVPDTWAALYAAAAASLAAAAPLVVGITGSNGKTSTKEMVAAVLAVRLAVLKTEGNLNTETGLPLTLLRLEPGRHQAAVLEMGMQGPGEIARLAALAQPRIGVITGIGRVHVEFFADGQEGIARAKAELIEALPAGGLAVLNADDPFTDRTLRWRTPARVTTFGLEGGDLRGEGYRAGAFHVRGVRVALGVPGAHMARNALAALAVGLEVGIPLSEAAGALARVEIGRRLQPLPGRDGIVVVDDAYNASPESMLAAFDAVAELPRQGRLLAVLGEMRELGEHATAAHRQAGEAARDRFDAVAVVAGGHAGVLADAAGADLVSDHAGAVAWVERHARPGDVVLVKASHGVALERVVEALLA